MLIHITARQMARLLVHAAIAVLCLACGAAAANAQSATVRTGAVRSKAPDRGSYRSPTISSAKLQSVDVQPVLRRAPRRSHQGQPVVSSRGSSVPAAERTSPGQRASARMASVRQVSDRAVLEAPVVDHHGAHSPVAHDHPSVVQPLGDTVEMESLGPLDHEYYDESIDACDGCGACDCMGGCGQGYLANAHIQFTPDRWFGSIELLLMERRGDLLPPLVTTGPSDDAATAGSLADPDTSILFGGATVFNDTTAGTRLNLGTYLDNCDQRSLVLRGWYGGQEDTNFSASNTTIPVLGRPIIDVSGGAAPTSTADLIAFPDQTFGSIDIRGESEVYGADISVRQFAYSRFGARLDVLYGYQYMRLDESLGISTVSTSLTDDVGVVGAVLAVEDSFSTENDFHGGQFGVAGNYREGCWSFDFLAKVGFGSVNRVSNLTGRSTTSVDTATSVDDQGLLVRDTNSGKISDSTFGWVPELNFTLGYHRFRQFDLTVGYQVIAMTDAIRPGETMDASLEVNLSDPLVGDPVPVRRSDFDTFYIQGIHFGISKTY